MRPHHDAVDIDDLQRPAAARGVSPRAPHDPLLSSKLAVPSPPAVLVARPRLHAVLDNASGSAVTCVSAPAGWGKTVLVASWVRARPDLSHVAWLSLEPGDDARRLWALFHLSLGLAPLDPVDGTPGPQAVSLVAERLLTLSQPMVVILDDFHCLDDAASLSAVEFLVRHACGRLRLVVLTRVDPPLPLLRWRLAGDVVDVGTEDLAFTAAETAELLDAHGTRLPETTVARLHEYYEGWPALIGLVGLAIKDLPRSASGDAMLAAAAPSMLEYLRRELWGGQLDGVRDTLLRTSIVDRLYPDLVATLTDRADGERQLSELARHNMFARGVATLPPSYRYHRAVAELMRRELCLSTPDTARELHRRAAAWHENAGLVGDALGHALAGRDLAHAASLVARGWHHVVLCPCRTAPSAHAGWLPEETSVTEPDVHLAWTAAYLGLGDIAGAARHLRLAERRRDEVSEQRCDAFAAAWTGLDVARARLCGDAEGVTSGARRLLELSREDRLGSAPREVVSAVATTALGTAAINRGDLEEAEELLAAALVVAERVALTCARAICASGLAFLRALRGELRAAESTAQAALAVPACPGQASRRHCALAYVALAMLNIEWDRLDEAETHVRLATDSCDMALDPTLNAIIAIVHAQVLHERGDPVRAYETLLAGRRFLALRPSAFLADWYMSVEAAVRVTHGDPDTVRQSFEPALASARAAPAGLAVVLARAYLAAGNPEAACRLLPHATERRGLPRALRLEAGLIDAVGAHTRGDRRGATHMLERVIEVAEPDGFRRVFVRPGAAVRELLVGHLESGTAYWTTVRDLVDAVDHCETGQATTPALSEALTDREVTVLRYLQSVLSNAEIASDMCLSVNTVKTHVRNIYRKLDTTRRRDAVRRARQLHLI